MLKNIRYSFVKLTKSLSYLDSISDSFMNKVLGHNKVIGWWRGYPIYSSFLVPGFSKPQGNLIAMNLIKNMSGKPIPGIVNIGITDRCNFKCGFCSFSNIIKNSQDKKLLSLEDIQKAIDQCLDLGVSVINFVGGEPLLNKDLPKIIEYIDKDRAVSSIFTNGWFLKEYTEKLKKAGIMQVNVSIDSPYPEVHDYFRRLKGAFKKAIEGIKECKKYKISVGISTTVTQKSLISGDFEKMILLSKKIGVNELIVLDMMPVGIYSHLKISKERINKKFLYELVKKYNDRKDFPGIFCYSRIKEVFGCCAGRNYFYISPYGEVYPCDFSKITPVGNLTKKPLKEIWSELVKLKESKEYFNNYCKKCNE